MLLFVSLNNSLIASLIHPTIKSKGLSNTMIDSLTKRDCIDITDLGPFTFPIPGKVISHYGKRGQQQHPGTDIKLQHGDTVRAAFRGIITRAMSYYGYGNLVVINHGFHTETYYAHLSKILVNPGDSISEGTAIGLGGRTGRATTDHLHFEVRVNGKTYNPELLFDFNNQQVLTIAIYPEMTSLPKKQKSIKEEKTAVAENLQKKQIQQPEVESYTIKKNDTLYSLAKRYSTTIKALCEINGITTSSKLKVGDKIKVNQL